MILRPPDSIGDPEDGRRRENTLSWSRKFRSKERKCLELDKLVYYRSMPLENQSFVSEEEGFFFHHFLNFFYIPTSFPYLFSSSHLPLPPPCTPPVGIRNDGVRPPVGINKAWHIKLRQDHAPPPASRLNQASHRRE